MLRAYQKLTHAIVNLVNAPRGQSYQQISSNYWLKPAQMQQLMEAGRLAVAQRLTPSTGGEISLRLASHQMAITARQSCLSQLAGPQDFMACPIAAGTPVDQAPLHLEWHRLIYRETGAMGVAFCRPPHALVLAQAERLPSPHLCPNCTRLLAG